MPSVRFSRDKRGYEYVYLVHTPTRRGKTGRTRVLYWYRTPPGVRIGRKPFDEEVQRTLEQQNPGITFDWEAIIATPMPPPDMTEYWRERRKAEKAARQERRAMEAEETGGSRGQAASSSAPSDAAETPQTGASADGFFQGEPGSASVESESANAEGEASSTAGPKKRRRRRGGRKRRVPGADASAVGPAEERQTGDAESAGPAGVDDADEAIPSNGDDPASEGE